MPKAEGVREVPAGARAGGLREVREVRRTPQFALREVAGGCVRAVPPYPPERPHARARSRVTRAPAREADACRVTRPNVQCWSSHHTSKTTARKQGGQDGAVLIGGPPLLKVRGV
jgi:hypothetical protein